MRRHLGNLDGSNLTKLDWTKAARPKFDPDAPVSVVDHGSFLYDDDHKFVPESKRALKNSKAQKAQKALLARSEKIRLHAIIKKFGEQRALAMGVPRDLVEASLQAKERKKLRRERRAAARATTTVKS